MGGRLPDGCGTFESVEFLLIHKDESTPEEVLNVKNLIGLFIVYDYPWRGGRTTEIDLVLTDHFVTNFNLLSLRTVILSYLFTIRGCAQVLWKRRKVSCFWKESLDRLKRQLRRLEENNAMLPRVVLQATPWTRAVFGNLSSNP